jgi:hypothetical protein
MNFMLQTRHQLKPAPSNRPRKNAPAQICRFENFMHLHDLSVGRRELPYAEHFRFCLSRGVIFEFKESGSGVSPLDPITPASLRPAIFLVCRPTSAIHRFRAGRFVHTWPSGSKPIFRVRDAISEWNSSAPIEAHLAFQFL